MENSKLAKAIIAVMKEVKGIDKSMTIGVGNGSYKGVPDQEVKKIIGDAMAKHGLTMLPIDVQAKTEVSRWEETYQGSTKQKQSVFTEVTTKYLLLHESGESQVISGYGHGVDSQDKGAGKATTYALKYALLYSFLVPTGKIDDADTTHSNDAEIAKPKTSPAETAKPFVKSETKMPINQKQLDKIIDRIEKGEKGVYDNSLKAFVFTDDQRADLELANQNQLAKII